MFNNGYILGPNNQGFKNSEASGNFMIATGGTIITDGNFKIHIFDSNGNFQILKLGSGIIKRLLIGGGAGGGVSDFGTFGGGGGGAGEYNYDPAYVMLALGIYPVVIGAGGIGAAAIATDGTDGGNSSFDNITCLGGGFGNGANYGSGVGGTGAYGGGGGSASGTGGTGIIAFRGGNSAPGFGGGGGGGGAGGAAPNAPNNNGGGLGGAGISNSITGIAVTYSKGATGGGNTVPLSAGVNPGDGGSGNLLNQAPAFDGHAGVLIISYQYR